MADAIVRLKVESQEYDSKLERATQKLQHMEKECRKIGGTFEYVDKEQLDLVKSLGQMETKATTARGKVAEMTKSYTELSLQYKRLSDQEKQSPFGKAMAQSLDQLKSRIKDANSEIKEVSQELGNGSNGLGGIMDALAGKIGIPTELLTKMGLAIGAVGAALKVAQDAFNANESLVDAWGRTVESATSLYEGFVTSLNTGDFGGFLSRMGEISTAARAAYDELDRLGTMKTIQGPEMSRQQAENDRNRAMLQTRRYIAPLDGSAGIAGMKTGDLLSDKQIKQIEADLQNGIKNISALIENEVQQTTNAIDAEYEKQASILGLTVEEFRKGTSSMAEFDKMIELGKKYYEFENAHTKTELQYNFQSGEYTPVTTRDNAVNPFAEYKKWSTFRVDGEDYNNLVKLIQQRDQQMSQAYSSQAQAYRTINRVEGITARGGVPKVETPKVETAKVDTAKIKTATDLWDQYAAKIAETERLLAEFQAMAANIDLTDGQRDWARGMADSYEEQLNRMKGATEEAAEEIKTEIVDIKAEMEKLPSSFDMFKDGVGSIGTMVSALDSLKTIGEDLASVFRGEMDAWDSFMTVMSAGVGIMETVISVIEAINVLTEISATLKQKNAIAAASEAAAVATGGATQIATNTAVAATAGTAAAANAAEGSTAAGKAVAGIPIVGPILAAAAIAAVLGAMIAAISSSKSAGKGFANGGIVPGNSFSGDNLHTSDYGINSGELILNRSQQNVIASQLQGGASKIRVEGIVSGPNILLAGSNYALQTGKAVKGLNGYALPIIAG